MEIKHVEFKEIEEIHRRRMGKECELLSISRRGRVITAEFGGNVLESCCAVDYFEDFAILLKELTKIPHAVFSADRLLDRFVVKIAVLDFVDEIKQAINECNSTVNARIKEFEEIGKHEESAFKELCFCILTANCSAKKAIAIQSAIGDGFMHMSKEELRGKLIELGYRFPNRADYIVEARKYCGKLLRMISEFKSSFLAREWLVDNVRGIGYKEASHFLRNIGFKDLAIIDRHVLKYLIDKEIVDYRSLNRKRYLELEVLLSSIANELSITLAELDLYIWYLKTGEVLK